jgi:hypothetical protein
MIQRQTSLTANVTSLCRYLRTVGFSTTPQEEADALRAVALLAPFDSPDDFRQVLKTVLCRTRQQVAQFDERFDYYWQQVKQGVDAKIAYQAEKKNQRPPAAEPAFQALKDWLFGNQNPAEEIEQAGHSAIEVLSKKDFSAMPAEELIEAFQLIRMIARRLARQQQRRFAASRRGRLDLPATLRKNLRRGGELIELSWKSPRKKRLRLVLLCDVSKSMELYSRFLLQFAYAFQQVFKRVETFVFSTSLTHVSRELQQEEINEMLTALAEKTLHWSGGTRIGACFDDFLKNHPGCLTSKTVVLILSDGWDTGDPELLAQSMATLRKKADKIIWLNPLAGSPAYRPEAGGMATAMPFVDVFLAAHNVESLSKIRF